jgi:hypothetical protein
MLHEYDKHDTQVKHSRLDFRRLPEIFPAILFHKGNTETEKTYLKPSVKKALLSKIFFINLLYYNINPVFISYNKISNIKYAILCHLLCVYKNFQAHYIMTTICGFFDLAIDLKIFFD